jgi:hypothetical protein
LVSSGKGGRNSGQGSWVLGSGCTSAPVRR